MKIGIVSYFDSKDNYGQILQCYALQTKLKNMGHSVFHLRHKWNMKQSMVKRLYRIFFCLLHGDLTPLLNKAKKVGNKNCRSEPDKCFEIDRRFDKFRDVYLNFSDKEYRTPLELKSISENPDAWIAGSDQIWYAPSFLYYLQFAKDQQKVLSYAASMGGVIPDSFNAHLIKKYLKKFDYISLREQDGVEVCKKLGYDNAKLVLDPTLLLNAEEYRKISISPKDKESYILLYLLGNPIGIDVKEIFDWASKNGLKIKYVAAQGREDVFVKEYPSPEEWLGLIDNSEYFITNSFHGMAFSIIFKKKFLILPIVGEWSRMNSRVTTTLDNLKIGRNRIYDGCFDVIKDNIDYSMPHQILEFQKEQIYQELGGILKYN